MPGNPFKPKASGFTPSVSPIIQLQEVMGKLSGSAENLFQGFSHLEDAVKAMDRAASRMAFLSTMSFGPRSPVPYDLRDVARHAAGGHGVRGGGGGGMAAHAYAFAPTPGLSSRGSSGPILGVPGGRAYGGGSPGPPSMPGGYAAAAAANPGVVASRSQSVMAPGSIVTRTIPGGPLLGSPAIGGLPVGPTGTKPGFGTPATGHSYTHPWTVGGGGGGGGGPPARLAAAAGGGDPPRGFVPPPDLRWSMQGPSDRRIVAAPHLRWSQQAPEVDPGGFRKDHLYPTFLGSSVAAAGLSKAGSPLAVDTLSKSIELLASKLGAGTVGPMSFMSRKFQEASSWADRNPEIAAGIGKAALLLAAVTASALAINIMAAAATNASKSLALLGLMGRGRGAANVAASVAGGIPPVVPVGGGGGALGLGTRAGRVAGLGSKYSVVAMAALAGFDMVDNLQGAFGPNKKYSANNYAFGAPLGLDPIINPMANAWNKPLDPDETSGPGGRYRKEFLRNNMGAVTALPQQALIGTQFKSITGYDLGTIGGESVTDMLDRPAVPFVGIGKKLNKWVSDIEESFGWSRSFDAKGGGPGTGMFDPKKDKGFTPASASKVHPAFTTIDDVYKQATLAALEDPLQAQVTAQQRKNDTEFLRNSQAATKVVADGLDTSKVGMKLLEAPPGLTTKP